MGVFPPQVALLRHSRQVLVEVSQTGDVPAQSTLEVHWTQAPEAEQAPRRGSLSASHWLAAVHAVHVLLVQTGVMPEQFALVKQATHRLVSGSQTGAVPLQSAFAVHWTQAPVLAHATRVGSPRTVQGMEAEQPMHCPFMQTGVVPEQAALDWHCTVEESTGFGSKEGSVVGRSATALSSGLLQWAESAGLQTHTLRTRSQYRPVAIERQSLSVAQAASSDLVGRQAMQSKQQTGAIRMIRTSR
jgi:hypothetical protein